MYREVHSFSTNNSREHELIQKLKTMCKERRISFSTYIIQSIIKNASNIEKDLLKRPRYAKLLPDTQ